MQVIPAIDLRAGQCVRLRQGDYDQETVFGEDPAAMAAHWEAEGASRIHLVDLDGAKDGTSRQRRGRARDPCDASSVPCQLGGGVRDEATIAAWLDAGLDRVIVGTQALKDPTWFRSMASKYPGRLVLGLDARDGRVATGGWLDVSSVEATTLAEQFDDLPLAAVVLYRHRARRDARRAEPGRDRGARAVRLKTPVIASGGVGTLEDLGRLAALPIAACIVGRALYEGRFRLSEARERAGDRSSTP